MVISLQSFLEMSLLVSFSAEALRSLYPNHSLVMTQTNLLGFPEVQVAPLEKTPLITNLLFVPVARSLGTVPGVLVDQVKFGAFQLTWKVSF
jgi:transitional endoplasmic reticulum ATPase